MIDPCNHLIYGGLPEIGLSGTAGPYHGCRLSFLVCEPGMETEVNELKWLRLYTEIIDDEKIRLLAFEDRWHYVAILCLKQSGVLDSENSELKHRKMAVKLGLSNAELDSLNKRLSDVELIHSDWTPVGWEERQFLSDTSKERTRKYRDKKKKLHCDVTVTSQ